MTSREQNSNLKERGFLLLKQLLWRSNTASAGIALVIFFALSLVISVIAVRTSRDIRQKAAITAPSTRISWQGREWYLHGVNMPWYQWGCDFGCKGSGGVIGNESAIRAGFQKLKNADVHFVRWWMFPGDTWQITKDASGAPSGINAAVYDDIDKALALAQEYDLYFNFVLFSGTISPQNQPYTFFTNADHRTKLANVLKPLFARYANNPRLMTWEIVNEPEWQIWNNQIGQQAVVDTVKLLTQTIHANSQALVTVGGAHLDGLPMWIGTGLDYYSPHWYDPMSSGGYCAICTDYTALRSRFPNLDRPVVIGELYLGSDINPLNRLNQFYTKGYAGAWPWSLFSDKTQDRMNIDMNAMASFSAAHPDAGPKSSGGITTAPTTAVPTATPRPPTATQPVPTSTNGTRLSLTIFLHGIGKGGDNVNPQSGGNNSPLHQQKTVTVELFNASNQLAATRQGTVNYNATSGNFTGIVDAGTIPGGVYTAKVKVPQYLKRIIPGILTINGGQNNQIPATVLVTGDSNNDNSISIIDYNLILDCFSDLTPARNCTDANKKLITDLTDDGNVNQFDYNLFLRELSVQGGDGTVPTIATMPTAVPTIPGNNGSLSIRVVGNHLVNQNGQTVQLRGINRSGTQYMCADGGAVFDGPSDNASIAAIKSWGVNVVRVNLNEHCWLGLSDIPVGFRGAAYQQVIGDYVNRLNAQGMYVIVDMHFNAPGTQRTEEIGAPDRDHAISYWTSVANYFKNNHAVLFDLYNEPTPSGGMDATSTWTCIRDGGRCGGFAFETEGMQQLVTAIRATGATHPILVAGPDWAGTLSRWIEFKPNDPANQLVASVHVYGQPLGSPYDDPATWNGDMARVAQQYPIVMGEIGDSDCSHQFVDQLMPWADSHGISYVAWSWIVGNCAGEPSLITSYNGTPSNYGSGVRNHLLSRQQ